MIMTEARPEISEGLWAHVMARAESEARYITERNFERNPDPLGNLPYHNTLHPPRVERRGVAVLLTIRSVMPSLVTPKDFVRVRIGAKFHDTVQHWEEKDGKRRRFTGRNEEESALLALDFMDRMNHEYGEIFVPEDKEIVKDEILTTTPGWANGTVIQPRITSSSHIDTISVATGDVNGGLYEPKLFLGEGDALFREENLDILRAFMGGVENIPADQAEIFRKRMIAWLEGQIKFVEGREALLNSDLSGIPEPAFSRVKALFDKGDESKRELGKLIEIRQKLPFPDLLNSFGYGSWLH